MIKFRQPTKNSKVWLESDCLLCSARYDIRIYPSEKIDTVNIHKRLIKTSDLVDRAIMIQSKTDVLKENGVLDERIKRQVKESQSH